MNLDDVIPHGTPAGYRRCRSGLWGACTDCRRANAEAAADRRANSPELRAYNTRISAARWRALGRLGRTYPDLYRTYLDEELEAS